MIDEPLEQDKQFAQESFFGKHNKTRIFTFELGSTAFLTFMAFCTAFIPPLSSSDRHFNYFHNICVTIIIYSIIVISGPITGAHLNPAVSIVYFKNKIKQKHDLQYFGSYVTSQIIGAFLGIILSKYIYDCAAGVYQITPSLFEVIQDVLGEFAATFMFIFFILLVTNQKSTFVYEEAWVHIFIAVAFFISKSFSQKIGSLNPAIILAMQTVAMINKPQIESINMVYAAALMVGQILGGVGAEIFFKKVYLKAIIEWRDAL